MTYLLDTHTLLWALTDPSSLGHGARRILHDTQHTIRVSAVSAWEIATKHRLGKLPAAAGLIEGYPHHLRRLGAAPLDVTADHALLAGRLDWAHRDPFDRMLAAQALIEGDVLLTRDTAFTDVSGLTVVW